MKNRREEFLDAGIQKVEIKEEMAQEPEKEVIREAHFEKCGAGERILCCVYLMLVKGKSLVKCNYPNKSYYEEGDESYDPYGITFPNCQTQRPKK